MKSAFNIKGAVITSLVFLILAIISAVYITIKTPKLTVLEVSPEITTTIYTTIYSTALETRVCNNDNIPSIILYLPKITKMENTVVAEVMCLGQGTSQAAPFYLKFHIPSFHMEHRP